MPDQDPVPTSKQAPPIGEVIDLVKEYARQETVAPLRGAARWLAFGTAGAVLLGCGTVLVLLGGLRMVQNEFGVTFAGRWMSLLPYVFALVFAIAVIAIAASRISKTSLHKD